MHKCKYIKYLYGVSPTENVYYIPGAAGVYEGAAPPVLTRNGHHFWCP